MDEHMGRRTVGGLLFTKGGSILLFREDSSRRKAGACCSRNGCNGTRHSADKGRPMHSHREAAAKEAAPTPRRSQPVRKPPQGSSNPAGPYSEIDNGTGEAATPGAGRDLLARLKDRVNASRKRSLAREMSSPSSSSGGFSASSSGGGATRSSAVSKPTRRAVSRIRKADEGENAGGSRRAPRRDTGGGDARGNSGDPVMVGQRAAREQAPTEGFISGFLARYRGSLQGGSSLQDGTEDSSGYWRFDVEGSEELENYFMLSDRHRAMRMDIDGMSYEELLALGDRIGTVNTGLSEDVLYKCLKRSLYTPTAPETHQDSSIRIQTLTGTMSTCERRLCVPFSPLYLEVPVMFDEPLDQITRYICGQMGWGGSSCNLAGNLSFLYDNGSSFHKNFRSPKI